MPETTKARDGIFSLIAVSLTLAAGWAISAPCEDINPNYKNGGGTKIGPFDYSDPVMQQRQPGNPSPLQLVESEHFTEKVRTLKGGNTSQMPGGDISYTLWAFPNHYPALVALINYATKYNSDQPPEMSNTAECYFKRAVQWRPKDSKTRLVFGIYLYNKNKIPESLEQFLEATRLDPQNGNSFYNLGLAYFASGNYEKSLAAAHSAYAFGFRLDGLKKKLTRAGRWRDPVAATDLSSPNEVVAPESIAPPEQ